MKKEYNGQYNKAGIYQIRNVKNGKFYIGSAKCFHKRAVQHQQKLNSDKHHNKHLLSSWKKYGSDAFVFEILEIVEGTTQKRRKIEQRYITNCLPNWDQCYNFQKKTSLRDRSCFSKNPELTRKKLSKSRKRFLKSVEWDKCREKMIKKLKGRPSSKRGKTFEEMYGKNRAKKLKKRISNVTTGENNPMFGKQHKQNTIDKIKQSKKNISPEIRKKISLANKGKIPHNKGKTFEEIYDIDTAKRMKSAVVISNKNRKISIESRKRRSKQMTGTSWGNHKESTKKLFSETRKGISFEERYGTERAKEIKNKIKISSKGRNAKTYDFSKNPLISPEKEEICLIINLQNFCNCHDLYYSSMLKLLKGIIKNHKNWHFKYQK